MKALWTSCSGTAPLSLICAYVIKVGSLRFILLIHFLQRWAEKFNDTLPIPRSSAYDQAILNVLKEGAVADKLLFLVAHDVLNINDVAKRKAPWVVEARTKGCSLLYCKGDS